MRRRRDSRTVQAERTNASGSRLGHAVVAVFAGEACVSLFVGSTHVTMTPDEWEHLRSLPVPLTAGKGAA